MTKKTEKEVMVTEIFQNYVIELINYILVNPSREYGLIIDHSISVRRPFTSVPFCSKKCFDNLVRKT